MIRMNVSNPNAATDRTGCWSSQPPRNGGELGLDYLRRRSPRLGRERGPRLLRPVRQRHPDPDVEGRSNREQGCPQRHQPPRRQAAQRVDQHAAHRVGEEDVAVPEQVGVEQPDDQQPAHAPVVHPAGAAAARLGPPRHQDDARAEQHREDRHELLVGEHSPRQPDVEVRAFEVAVGGGVEVGRLGHRERLDVHDEDAEQGEPAQDVDRDDARGLGDGSGVGPVRGAGHVALLPSARGPRRMTGSLRRPRGKFSESGPVARENRERRARDVGSGGLRAERDEAVPFRGRQTPPDGMLRPNPGQRAARPT